MYIPPQFRTDRAASLAFAQAHGFGLVCTFDGDRPVASPLPFHLDYAADGTPRLAFHIARGNPLAALATAGGQWLISVSGPHTYVSPHWYASADQVPTWLYQIVQLSGPARVVSPEDLPEHLDALSATFEGMLAPKTPWTLAEISAGRREGLLRAIVGVVVDIERVEGSFKLNQHKSDADHAAIVDALAEQANGGAQDLAAVMRAMRPLAVSGVAAAGSEATDNERA